MFHGETLKSIKNLRIHEILFYVFLFLIPVQIRILYQPETAYISWYFNYHLAFFVYLTDLILVSCFISWLSFDFLKPQTSNLKPFSWLTLAFFSTILFSLSHVKHLDLALYQTFKWLEVFFLVLYICFTANVARTGRILWILFVSSVSQAIIGLWQFHVQHSLNLGFLGEYIAPLGTPGLATIDTVAGKVIRAYGTMPHPNVLAAFLVLGLICGLLIGFRVQRTGYRLIVACGTILITIALFATFSRLAWIAGAICILAFLLFHVQRRNWSKVMLIVIVTVVSCVTILVLWHGLLFARTLDSNATSINDRVLFNKMGSEIMKQNPILGVGVGNYVPALQAKYQLQPWQYQPPHNILLFIGAELGLVGLGLFIAILILIFWRLRKIKIDELSFSVILLAIVFLIMAQFDHYFVTIQQGRLMFAVVLGLVAVLPSLEKN